MNEEQIQLNSTRLLTEHFGFQPITVIDDIINVINEIMYRCTEQLEQILINQKVQLDEATKEKILQQKNDDVILDDDADNNNSSNREKYTIEDIQTGTATLESYLEHSINRNFDKFEIYALRNVFNIPEDLISGGYIRLKHHEGLEIFDNVSSRDHSLSQEMIETIRKIRYQVELNKVLCDELPKLEKLSKLSKLIKFRLQPFIDNESNSIENRKKLAKLTPLNDTLLFLATQLRNTCDKVNSIKKSIDDEALEEKFSRKSEEEEQLNQRINIIIQKVGGEGNKTITNNNQQFHGLENVNSGAGQNIVDFFSKDNNNVIS